MEKEGHSDGHLCRLPGLFEIGTSMCGGRLVLALLFWSTADQEQTVPLWPVLRDTFIQVGLLKWMPLGSQMINVGQLHYIFT